MSSGWATGGQTHGQALGLVESQVQPWVRPCDLRTPRLASQGLAQGSQELELSDQDLLM